MVFKIEAEYWNILREMIVTENPDSEVFFDL
jgi:hypothetical protein